MRCKLSCALLALVASGCLTPESPLPGARDVEVMVVGSATVSYAQLRVVVLFEGDEGELETGADVAVTSTGTPVRLRLTAPALNTALRREALPLTPNGENIIVARPRIIAYLDLDGSESYQYGAQRFGPDQPLGADGYWHTLGWLPEPEAQLSALSPEGAQRYYEIAGQRYTPFVTLRRKADGTLIADEEGEPLEVDATRLSITPADLACQGNLRNAATPIPEILMWVDRSLEADTLCGLDVADCRPVDTSTLTPPALPDPELDNPFVATYAQCRRRRGLDLLVVETQRLRCEPSTCGCATAVGVVAVATSTSVPAPAWWPCGQQVDYCDSNLSLYRVDPACFPEPEEDE